MSEVNNQLKLDIVSDKANGKVLIVTTLPEFGNDVFATSGVRTVFPCTPDMVKTVINELSAKAKSLFDVEPNLDSVPVIPAIEVVSETSPSTEVV